MHLPPLGGFSDGNQKKNLLFACFLSIIQVTAAPVG